MGHENKVKMIEFWWTRIMGRHELVKETVYISLTIWKVFLKQKNLIQLETGFEYKVWDELYTNVALIAVQVSFQNECHLEC